MCLNNSQNLLRPQVPGAKAESLDIKNIAGIFVLLVMGLVLALVIAIAERLLYGFTRNTRKTIFLQTEYLIKKFLLIILPCPD